MNYPASRSQPRFRLKSALLALALACLAQAELAYGAKDPTDVTAVVAGAVKDDKLSITAGNDLFGDTASGVPKKLHIEYTLGDEKVSRDVGENRKLEIAAPAGKKLVITKAVYGPADGSKPKTVAIIDPGLKIDPNYPAWVEGVEKGYFCRRQDGNLMKGSVWPGLCHFPDFTRPEVRDWWAGLADARVPLLAVWITLPVIVPPVTSAPLMCVMPSPLVTQRPVTGPPPDCFVMPK